MENDSVALPRGMSLSREAARKAGQYIYLGGEACTVCGESARYTVNGNCVQCSAQRAQKRPVKNNRTGDRNDRAANAELLREAIATGAKMYERITPCVKCAAAGDAFSVMRYTSNGGCVACIRRNSVKKYANAPGRDGYYPSVVIPSACTCHHGEELRKYLPELDGRTLILARHWFTDTLHTGDAPHYGRCALCYPSRTIGLFNALCDRATEMPAELRESYRLLYFVCTKQPGESESLIVRCMREYNMRFKGGGLLNLKLPS